MKNTTTIGALVPPHMYHVRFNTLGYQWDGVQNLNDPNDPSVPQWLRRHIKTHALSSTIDGDRRVINLSNKRGKYIAFPGDWICEDDFQHLFVWSQKTFNKRTTAETGGN